MYKGIIYEYYCTVTKGYYVGQTTNPQRRQKEHIQAAKGQRTDSHTYFHRAMNKYGIDKFEYRVVKEYEADTLERLQSLLDEAEKKQIVFRDSQNNGYNITEGGLSHESWNKGKTGVYSENTIQKMRNAKVDYVPWNKGLTGIYHPTEETKSKTSESMKAAYVNNEGLRQQISEAAKGRIWISNDELCKTKFVKQNDLQEFLNEGWIIGRNKY